MPGVEVKALLSERRPGDELVGGCYKKCEVGNGKRVTGKTKNIVPEEACTVLTYGHIHRVPTPKVYRGLQNVWFVVDHQGSQKTFTPRMQT